MSVQDDLRLTKHTFIDRLDSSLIWDLQLLALTPHRLPFGQYFGKYLGLGSISIVSTYANHFSASITVSAIQNVSNPYRVSQVVHRFAVGLLSRACRRIFT